MAITTPILGNASVRIGQSSTLTNATAGGSWSSNDTDVCTIGASSGIVTGVGVGCAAIIYTVGADSISVSFQVYQSTITNGFDITRVFPAFQGRLGWHQPTMSGMPTLSAANKLATSGKYFDRGYHKAVSIQNYFETQENPDITNDQFNQLLQDEDQACIMRCLNAIFNKPQLIEHTTNYTRQANIRNIVIPNGGNFCGYRMNIAPNNYAVNIDSIGLAFDGVATFNMYLFNDLLLAPVYVKEVTTVANSQVKVQLDWVINFLNSDNSGNLGGVWYMGYFQDDLGSVHALDEQLNLWADSKIFGAYPFQSPKTDGLDFNRRNPSVNFRSYGINFEASSYRDYTQTIVQNAQLFDEARGLMMGINVLEQILFSSRTNANQRIMQDLANKLIMDLDIHPTKAINAVPSGIKLQLAREMERINQCFNKMPVACSQPIGNADWWNEAYYEGFDVRNLPSRENAY